MACRVKSTTHNMPFATTTRNITITTTRIIRIKEILHRDKDTTYAEAVLDTRHNNNNNNNNNSKMRQYHQCHEIVENNQHQHQYQCQHQSQQKQQGRSLMGNMLVTAANCTNFATTSSGCYSNIKNNNNNNNNYNNNKMHNNKNNICFNIKISSTILLGLLYFLTCCDLTCGALQNVNLYVEPPAVRRSQSVILRCEYTLEGAPLYSIKFYRGHLEFFRYTPGEHPSTKVFPYPGIKVDESMSNATQVVIRNVGFGLSGNFSCEVTADAPLYSTATAYAHMQVVEFPEKRPVLFSDQVRYEPGDVLRANCSTPPSRPRAEIKFTINNIPVSSEETQYIRTVDNLIASRQSLILQLQGVHFTANSNSHMMNAFAVPTIESGGGGMVGGMLPYSTMNVHGSHAAYQQQQQQQHSGNLGSLILRCTATIGDLYQEYKEIELGAPQKDPVPARVTLSSGSSLSNFLENYFSSGSSSFSSTAWFTSNHNFHGYLTRQMLNLGLAAGALVAFHWLRLCY